MSRRDDTLASKRALVIARADLARVECRWRGTTCGTPSRRRLPTRARPRYAGWRRCSSRIAAPVVGRSKFVRVLR